MDLVVTPETSSSAGTLRWTHGMGRHAARCALGRGGVSSVKREGDGATPIGRFPLRLLLYRPDHIVWPHPGMRAQALESRPIHQGDGWCDDPVDPAYNTPVRLPYSGRHERLWRDDRLYDLVIVVGYNDAPVIPGRGSAIFIHLATADYAPTAGCVALALGDLQRLAAACAPGDDLVVEPA